MTFEQQQQTIATNVSINTRNSPENFRVIMKRYGNSYRIYLVKKGLQLTRDIENSKEANFITFDIQEIVRGNSSKKAVFHGMHINPNLRGEKIADYFFGIFINTLKGLNVVQIETVSIRKPLLVKKLLEWGFTPRGEVKIYAKLKGFSDEKKQIPKVDIYTSQMNVQLQERSQSGTYPFFVADRIKTGVDFTKESRRDWIPLQTRFEYNTRIPHRLPPKLITAMEEVTIRVDKILGVIQ